MANSMTLAEMLAEAKARAKPPRRRGIAAEHKLQTECVRWFRLQYPNLAPRLFAVPNGGRRDATTAKRLKEEGVLAGVSDLILLKQCRQRSKHYGALLIEMKTMRHGSAQSSAQMEWQANVTAGDEYKYVVCRSFDAFRSAVENYLTGCNI